MKYLNNLIYKFEKHHKIKDMDSFIDGMKFYKELLLKCKGRECLDLLHCIDKCEYSN